MAVKAKTTAAEAPEETTVEERKAAREAKNSILRDQIVKLRDEDEKKWDDITTELDVAQGKAMYLYLQAHVAPKDRIKAKTDEDMAAAIVKARDEDLLSWAQISVRSGVVEGRCHRLYEQATGESTLGNRIGKGGRYPDGVTPPTRSAEGAENAVKKAAAKKAAAKKAPVKKATPAAESPLFTMDGPTLAKHLIGKTIAFKVDGAAKRASVAGATVVGTGPSAVVTITTAKGGEATLTLDTITKVG